MSSLIIDTRSRSHGTDDLSLLSHVNCIQEEENRTLEILRTLVSRKDNTLEISEILKFVRNSSFMGKSSILKGELDRKTDECVKMYEKLDGTTKLREDELVRNRSVVEDLNMKLSRYQEVVHDLENRLSTSHANLSASRANLSNAKDRCDELKSSINSNQLKEENERVHLHNDVHEKCTEIANLKLKLEIHVEEKRNHRSVVEDLNMQLSRYQEVVHDLENSLSASQVNLSNANERWIELKSSKLKEKNERLHNDVHEKCTEIANLKSKLDIHVDEKHGLEIKLCLLQSASKEISDKNNHLQKLNDTFNSTQEMLDELVRYKDVTIRRIKHYGVPEIGEELHNPPQARKAGKIYEKVIAALIEETLRVKVDNTSASSHGLDGHFVLNGIGISIEAKCATLDSNSHNLPKNEILKIRRNIHDVGSKSEGVIVMLHPHKTVTSIKLSSDGITIDPSDERIVYIRQDCNPNLIFRGVCRLLASCLDRRIRDQRVVNNELAGHLTVHLNELYDIHEKLSKDIIVPLNKCIVSTSKCLNDHGIEVKDSSMRHQSNIQKGGVYSKRRKRQNK